MHSSSQNAGTTRSRMSATMSGRDAMCNRTGSKGKIFTVRRDPNLARKDVIRDANEHKFQFISGSTYKGEWRDNKKHGFGVHELPDGTKYEGSWEYGKRHGLGTLWVVRGGASMKQYAGNWEFGKMSGSGMFSYDNGDVYTGEWASNQRSGNGKLQFVNGDVYIGQWLNDKSHGHGVLHLANGNKYDGSWVDGVKEGPGRFFYAATNKVYEGEWVNDCPKCGEFRDPRADETAFMGPSAVFKHPYDLPEIKLANSRTIVDVAVAEARIEGSIRRGIANSGIDASTLERAEKLFYDLDRENSGAVEPSLLEPVFRALGVYITVDEILYVMVNFDMDGMTDLSFPEVVEIASFLLENQ